MKTRTIVVALIALLIVCSGCKKKEDDRKVITNQFTGTYELAIDYEVYIDGELSEEPGFMDGILTITAIDETTVSVKGEVNMNETYVTLYDTKGTIDKDGILRLEKSYYNGGSAPIEIFYYDMEYGSPLVFRTVMITSLQGYRLEYEMTNTATKR